MQKRVIIWIIRPVMKFMTELSGNTSDLTEEWMKVNNPLYDEQDSHFIYIAPQAKICKSDHQNPPMMTQFKLFLKWNFKKNYVVKMSFSDFFSDLSGSFTDFFWLLLTISDFCWKQDIFSDFYWPYQSCWGAFIRNKQELMWTCNKLQWTDKRIQALKIESLVTHCEGKNK